MIGKNCSNFNRDEKYVIDSITRVWCVNTYDDINDSKGIPEIPIYSYCKQWLYRCCLWILFFNTHTQNSIDFHLFGKILDFNWKIRYFKWILNDILLQIGIYLTETRLNEHTRDLTLLLVNFSKYRHAMCVCVWNKPLCGKITIERQWTLLFGASWALSGVLLTFSSTREKFLFFVFITE